MDIYKVGIRPLLFTGLKSDPEWLHQQTMRVLSRLERLGDSVSEAKPLALPAGRDRSVARWVKAQLQQSLGVSDARLTQKLWGIAFPNPVGLAAGFDKDGVAASVWSSLGFGFAELGTVTLHAQPGNPRPRLFRLPLDHAALNRMGFNNCGAAAMKTRLADAFSIGKTRLIPIGINLGKSKVTPLDEAAVDYLGSFRLLKNWGDYFVVNVSSPNTPGLRSLQDAAALSCILDALQQENQGQKPIFVKIAPDLAWEAIAEIMAISEAQQLAGIIATNTTIRRDGLKTSLVQATGKSVYEEAGGVSGAPLRDRATEVIRFIWQQTRGQLPVIGVGGIFTAEDAWEKITAGASLVQVYTGWIYEGPLMVRRVLQGLLQKLEERGLNSISDAVGLENSRL